MQPDHGSKARGLKWSTEGQPATARKNRRHPQLTGRHRPLQGKQNLLVQAGRRWAGFGLGGFGGIKGGIQICMQKSSRVISQKEKKIHIMPLFCFQFPLLLDLLERRYKVDRWYGLAD